MLFLCFNLTSTTAIDTLSLHDALPISDFCLRLRTAVLGGAPRAFGHCRGHDGYDSRIHGRGNARRRSEEHTSELQSLTNLVCRLLLEKKKNNVIQCNETNTDSGS